MLLRPSFLILSLCLLYSGVASGQESPLAGLDLDPDAPPTAKLGSDPSFHTKLLQEALDYERGKGYRRNPTRAVEIYKMLSAGGNQTAAYHLARCHIEGGAIKRNVAKGRSLLRELAKKLSSRAGFKRVPGINPITGSTYKNFNQISPGKVSLRTFKTRKGKSIEQPKVLTITQNGMRVMHAAGIESLVWTDLPGYVQRSLGYDETSILLDRELEIIERVRARLSKK